MSRVLAAVLVGLVVSPLLAQAPPAMVRLGEVREETLSPRRQVVAELRSPRVSEVASFEAGIVTEVCFREGDPVAEGEVLARLDDSRLVLDRAHAEADLAATAADLAEREAEERQARRDLALVEESRAAGAANERELLDARSRLEISIARQERARRDIEVAAARLALFERRIADLAIRAPFEGVVTEQWVERGQWLAAGGKVATVVELGRLEAWLSLPQAIVEAHAAILLEHAPDPPPGVEAVILQIGATGEALPLERLRLVPEVERRGRTFTVIGSFDNRERHLLPGLSAAAHVPAGAKQPYRTVPKDAVLVRENGAMVYVARPGSDGTTVAVPVPLELAFPLGDRWAIRGGGVEAGDRVVIEGNERLMPMAAIVATGN